MGGPKYFLGGYDWLNILIFMESIIFVKFLTSNNMLFIPEEYPDPSTPYPLDLNRGGPVGGPGGLRGVI